MKLIQITFDITTILMYAASKEDAMDICARADEAFVKLEPNGKWVYQWAEDAIMWSDINIEEVEQKPGVIFRVSH